MDTARSQDSVYDGKLTSKTMIVVAAFVFGPMAAALFIARNCLNLGRKRTARKVLTYGCIYTAILIILAALTEGTWYFLVFPIADCILAWLAVESTHGKELEDHIRAGGPEYHALSNILVAFAGAAITGVIYFILYGIHSLIASALANTAY